ncbi:hypothetical protein ACVW1C_008510 [Bradyrhizobium sp. USDA 4011]|uniref:hypothetical protein n=1 Tax=Bradyrhizobium TaxID=374 RepID=UPI000421A67C|nr:MULTISPECIES: hypothetical protein [Bradyrhizobium]MCL8488276.1 hypothetical protein [Bradyrhizobium denitrificans]RTM15529.1 MAG: hypothetical protein EKK33_00820 [Bradyrhizobiaceae bacterium]
MRAPKKGASKARKRSDKRSQLLVYLRPTLIRQLKLAALAMGQPAYELAETAIAEWLEKRQSEIRRAAAEIADGNK